MHPNASPLGEGVQGIAQAVEAYGIKPLRAAA